MRSLNLTAMIDFYDRMVPESKGHATAINAVMGEEFATALFFDYANKNKLIPKVISEICTQGTQKGKRLDRWIEVSENGRKIHYQTEIKNWSAHAFSGKKIPTNESEDYLKPYRISRWNIQFDSDLKTLKQEPARKVLIQMKSLDKEAEIRPLIIFWDSLHPDGNPEPFFNVAIDGSHFERLWIFSMSTYVRGLINSGVNELPVHMPNVVERLDWLNKIYRSDF
jgi:hypothetical protein